MKLQRAAFFLPQGGAMLVRVNIIEAVRFSKTCLRIASKCWT